MRSDLRRQMWNTEQFRRTGFTAHAAPAPHRKYLLVRTPFSHSANHHRDDSFNSSSILNPPRSFIPIIASETSKGVPFSSWTKGIAYHWEYTRCSAIATRKEIYGVGERVWRTLPYSDGLERLGFR